MSCYLYLSPTAGNQKIKTLVCDVMLISTLEIGGNTAFPPMLCSQLIKE